MDQAAKLREIVNKRNNNVESNLNMISVVSGKGGVGKTTLVTLLYSECNNSFIIDSDINAPYFWFYEKDYKCSSGFENFNGKKIVRSVEKHNRLDKYDFVFVDAGTGINDVNEYFINKSKLTIFISNMEEISILNTMNLMKKVEGNKAIYFQSATPEQFREMQLKVNKYSKLYLDCTFIKVFNSEEEIIRFINSKKY